MKNIVHAERVALLTANFDNCTTSSNTLNLVFVHLSCEHNAFTNDMSSLTRLWKRRARLYPTYISGDFNINLSSLPSSATNSCVSQFLDLPSLRGECRRKLATLSAWCRDRSFVLGLPSRMRGSDARVVVANSDIFTWHCNDHYSLLDYAFTSFAIDSDCWVDWEF